MLNPPTPRAISNPIIGQTHHMLDAEAASEAAAASFEYDILNGNCYYTRGKRFDMDSVMEDTLNDVSFTAELEELLTNTKMASLMKNVTTLKEYFQDHMDEATDLLVRGAESGDIE